MCSFSLRSTTRTECCSSCLGPNSHAPSPGPRDGMTSDRPSRLTTPSRCLGVLGLGLFEDCCGREPKPNETSGPAPTNAAKQRRPPKTGRTLTGDRPPRQWDFHPPSPVGGVAARARKRVAYISNLSKHNAFLAALRIKRLSTVHGICRRLPSTESGSGRGARG